MPPLDLAFTIYGQAVPKPSGSMLLTIVGLYLSIFTRRHRVMAWVRPARRMSS
jgi:hypothetical protein